MRQLKREVKIGNVTIGGNHPIAVQTMLNAVSYTHLTLPTILRV